ncbi:BTAD domain-containing putative transcriptional regulator [Cellulomonas gilvus]|uniref:BTAD domain-containing putative transcriptional regulator n=1 Tax=Cellulomonas gilvus TaxID=11 RepID=UPI0002DEA1BF|nr:BTAD domain-containing putative transcriptional regulator [Cellulomonas gilvus]
MHVTTLGPLAIDGHPVRGERLAAVVRELVDARGRAVSVGALVDAVWDGAPPDDATGAVQALVSRVRRLGLAVQSTPGGYRVPADDVRVDADEARDLLETAHHALRAGDVPATVAAAAQARALLPAVPDTPVAVHLLADAAAVAAQVALRTGGPFDETDLRTLAAGTPPDEPSVAMLVRVLAAQGRDAEALDVVERLRTELVERYGTDPSPVVAQVHLALLRGELAPVRPAAPAPAAADALPAAWRRPAAPLVGRAADVDAVLDGLATARVVTVVATGGAGKTRLATEVARRVGDRPGRTVHVVELAGLRSPEEVLPAVVAVLGGAETVGARTDVTAERRVLDPVGRLRAATQELDGLVVLDNCEHVLDAAADVVAMLLSVAGPELAVLATSRAPLGLMGERVHRLGTLPDDDALALLRDRARAGRADLPWDDERALALCHRLDNLPLALELAAARLRAMPVQDVLDGLHDRFALLDDALRGLPERHASLWAMVDWSRALLDADDRDLLQRLSVVPAAFTAATAAAVAGRDEAAVRRGLAVLVDQSLLALDDDGVHPARYRMLETVREYGDARLQAAGDRAAAMRGLVAWAAAEAVDLAARLVGPGQLDALAACARDQETFVGALRWALAHDDEAAAVDLCAALFHWWTIRGLHVETVTWATRLLAADDPARRRTSALYAARRDGDDSAPHGDRLTAAAVHAAVNSGVTASNRLAALAGRVLRGVRGEQAAQVGDRMRAVSTALPAMTFSDPARAELAAAELARHGDPWVRGLGTFLGAAVRENAGDPASCVPDALAAYALFRQAGDHWGMGMTAQAVAQWSARLGGEDVMTWLERAIEHLELVGALLDARSLRLLLDVQHALTGQEDRLEALRELAAAPHLEPMDRAQALLGLGQVLLGRRERDEAAQHVLRAVDQLGDDEGGAPQSRTVLRVAAAVLLLHAAVPDGWPDEPGGVTGVAGMSPDDVQARVVEIVTPTAADVARMRDMPVIGAYALGTAELAAFRGDAATAAELWSLGTRLGATIAWITSSLDPETSLTVRLTGPAATARVGDLRALPIQQVTARIETIVNDVLGARQTLRR